MLTYLHGSPPKSCTHIFPFSPMRATCLAHFILSDLTVDSSDHAALIRPFCPLSYHLLLTAPNTPTPAVFTLLHVLEHILNHMSWASRFAKETWIFLLRLQLPVNEITGSCTKKKKPFVVVLPPYDNNTGTQNYGNQKKKFTFCLSRKNWTREPI